MGKFKLPWRPLHRRDLALVSFPNEHLEQHVAVIAFETFFGLDWCATGYASVFSYSDEDFSRVSYQFLFCHFIKEGRLKPLA